MTNAAHHIRVAVEGLAREIGRRTGQEQRELNERDGQMPPGVEFWTDAVEHHAKVVLLDYLLGDFNPVSEVQPHHYVPSAMHMGDCDVCGHTQQSPMHLHMRK